MQFWGFSVLHCHGVFLSGDQQQQQKLLQRQEEKVAKIHSSSKKKKPLKSSFSMGFRSYVRHFRSAILGLLRSSLPWCFPIRGPAAAAKASAAAGGKGSQNSYSQQQQEETVAKIIIFYGFQKLREAFSGCNFGASPFFTAMVFSYHGVFLSGDQQQQQQKPLQRQEEKVAKIHSSKKKKPPKSSFSIGFRSYVRYFRTAILGLLRPSLPWCFPTAMVFSYPGTSRRKR